MKAILWDLDGVLVDAADWHYQALNQALVEVGYPAIDRETHLTSYNGLPTRKKLALLNVDEAVRATISKLKKGYFNELLDHYAKPDPVKIELLTQLATRYRLACCSNSIKESVLGMLLKTELLPFFELVIGNDEVQNPKPDPEIYHQAMTKLELKARQCLIVEDAPPGVEAARASGASVLVVNSYQEVNLELFQRLGYI